MAIDSLLMMSLGFNFIQLGIWIRERRLRIKEKKRFASYLAKLEKRINKLEKK